MVTFRKVSIFSSYGPVFFLESESIKKSKFIELPKKEVNKHKRIIIERIMKWKDEKKFGM